MARAPMLLLTVAAAALLGSAAGGIGGTAKVEVIIKNKQCAPGFRHPSEDECERIAEAVESDYERVADENAHPEEFGCFHWGAGTEEAYHVEFMPSHEDHTEDTGCAIEAHEGWCYCIEEGAQSTDAIEMSNEQRGECPPGFVEDTEWRDDAGNGCPTPDDSATGHDIDFVWCLVHGTEEFLQSNGEMKTGKQACAACCMPYPTNECPAGFKEDRSWMDDAENGCPGDGHPHDITVNWCRFYGNQPFEQKDGSTKSGKESCAICCDIDAIDHRLHEVDAPKEVIAECPHGFKEDAQWRDDAGNPCPEINPETGDDLDFGWCREFGDEEFVQLDGTSKTGKQACAVCCQPFPTDRCAADFVEDRTWRDDSDNGCPGDGHAHAITVEWCRDFGSELFEQEDGTMKSGKQACAVCCNVSPLPYGGAFVASESGACPDGYRVPTEPECKSIASQLGDGYERISDAEAHPNEYGCYHWGAGTAEKYHVEYQPSHPDHTDETGCAIAPGEGWCYCIEGSSAHKGSKAAGGGGGKVAVIVIVVLLVLGLVAGGAYFAIKKNYFGPSSGGSFGGLSVNGSGHYTRTGDDDDFDDDDEEMVSGENSA